MKILYSTILLLLAFVTTFAQKNALTEPYVLNPPPMVALLANPEKYDGKRIRISGFLHFEFEDSALYLSKTEGDYLITESAIWVRYDDKVVLDPIECKGLPRTALMNLEHFRGRYVTLDGTFHMKERGHMGMFSGSLENVTLVQEMRRWRDGAKPAYEFDSKDRIIEGRCAEPPKQR